MKSIQVMFNQQSPYQNDQMFSENFADVERFHLTMPSYLRTPTHSLKSLANELGVKGLYVKDESSRFGLNAFKGLGVSYALHQIMKAHPNNSYTFVSCTDGNHGKALAWQAQELGCRAIIFMPKGSEQRRVKAIEQYQAQVIITEMNYDDTVRYAAEYAKEHHFYFVQDTSLPGYTQIPNDIIMGYSTMVKEALDQIAEKPTHVFVQAGVGSLAGGVLWYLLHRYSEKLPFIGIIEAESVGCIYESIRQDKMVSIGGSPYTAMAGLNCGEPNPSSFPLLKSKANCFIKCTDAITFKGMTRAKNPIGDDIAFSSGESGAVGLGFVEEIMSNPTYHEKKQLVHLDSDSVILLFNTEGVILND